MHFALIGTTAARFASRACCYGIRASPAIHQFPGAPDEAATKAGIAGSRRSVSGLSPSAGNRNNLLHNAPLLATACRPPVDWRLSLVPLAALPLLRRRVRPSPTMIAIRRNSRLRN